MKTYLQEELGPWIEHPLHRCRITSIYSRYNFWELFQEPYLVHPESLIKKRPKAQRKKMTFWQFDWQLWSSGTIHIPPSPNENQFVKDFPNPTYHGNPDVTQFQELSFRSFEFGRLPCYQLPWLRKRCRFNLWLIWYMFRICMCTYLYTRLSYARYPLLDIKWGEISTTKTRLPLMRLVSLWVNVSWISLSASVCRFYVLIV